MSKWLVFLFVLAISGCATVRKTETEDTQMQSLQGRLRELEQELERKDEEIWLLQQDAQRSSYEASSNIVPRTSTASTSKPLSTRQIQTALKKAGFYNGAVDGKIGKASKQAIVGFQKANNLKADGIVGRRTSEELRRYLP